LLCPPGADTLDSTYRGGWPIFVGAITIEAAPALLLLQSWAPRTAPPCSFVTYEPQGPALDLACAQPTSSLLRRRVSAPHHHQLLSADAIAGQAAVSRSYDPCG